MLPSISAQEVLRAIFLRSRIAPKRTVESSDPLRHPNPVPPKMRDDPGPISAPLGSRKKERARLFPLPLLLLLYPLSRPRASSSFAHFPRPRGTLRLSSPSLPPSLSPRNQRRSVGRSVDGPIGRSVGRPAAPAIILPRDFVTRARTDGDPSLL